MVAPVQHGDGERGGLRHVEIGGEARKGDPVELLGDGGVVRQDEAGGRAAETLVGAHRHQMRALFERLRPDLAGDQTAQMRGVEQHQRADLVGDAADLAHRMGEQVEARPDRDHFRTQTARHVGQRVDVDRVAVGQDGRGVNFEPVAPGAAGEVMGDVAADRRRRRDDPVARLRAGHEGVEIGDGARRNADFGVARSENLGAKFGGDDLDALGALQTHFVFIARIAERGPRSEPARERGFGARVHHVGGGIEVEAIAVVDRSVEVDRGVDRGQRGRRAEPGRFVREGLDERFAGGRNPVSIR
jgi:hypothetical protein